MTSAEATLDISGIDKSDGTVEVLRGIDPCAHPGALK